MNSAPAVLKVAKLTKAFFGARVLHEVSFEVHAGQVLGVVGENGSGKSTTMNLLAGVLPRDGGEVWLAGEPFNPTSRRESDAAGIAFIQQELSIFPNLSVAENLFLIDPPRFSSRWPVISRRRMYAQTQAFLYRVDLDVSPRALAGSLSAGERQLLEIARALATDAQVFIFDEPTSSLTSRESTRLFELIARIKANGAAVIFISHNLEDVLKISDRVMVMRDGRVVSSARRQDLSAEQLIFAMVGRPIEALFPERPTRLEAPALLEVSGLSEPGVLRDIDLQVGQGEIVGLSGLMGSGRSELARAIFGLDAYRSGTVVVNGRSLGIGAIHERIDSGMAFVTEDRRHEGLLLNATIADNVSLAALPSFARSRLSPLDRPTILEAMRGVLRSLYLKGGDSLGADVRTLSGGNQQKVVLGRWLLRQPKVFILDEPTRGVDVGAKTEIYRLLAHLSAEGMAILIISSELEELLGLCDRLYVMRRGALTAEFSRPAFDREAILSAAFGQGRAA